jgi:anti-anti-sigma regulatory factor
MLLRISAERLGEATLVRVAGRLVGEGVEELSRVCAASPRPLRIDLAGLLHADELGLSLLRSLRASGAQLADVSPFIRLLLDPERDRAAN